MMIKLVRHGESEMNAGVVSGEMAVDPQIGLTAEGQRQALLCGQSLREYLAGALVYVSPYTRTRQTLAFIHQGAELPPGRVFEEPRLREMEWGFGKSEAEIERERALRARHGWFYYRMAGGESPADVSDRVSGFIDSLHRQVARKGIERVLIVTHGIVMRCFAMRWLHLKVEDYDRLKNPVNCEVVTIAPRKTLAAPQFICGKWGVEGLRFFEESES